MGEMFVWIFLGLGALVLVAMIYHALKCNHEWEQHTFEIGGATKYYLTCKKCGKVKVLK